MSKVRWIVMVALMLLAPAARAGAEGDVKIDSITPILLVEEVETSLGFWVDRLGFEVSQKVEDEGRIAFAMLTRGETMVMLQSREGQRKDLPALAGEPFKAFLYIRLGGVPVLEDVIRRLDGIEPAVPRRKTFYGADEIAYREPDGHVVVFAAFPEENE